MVGETTYVSNVTYINSLYIYDEYDEDTSFLYGMISFIFLNFEFDIIHVY